MAQAQTYSWTQVANCATNVSLFLTTLTSPDRPLSPTHELFCLSLFHLPILHSLITMVSAQGQGSLLGHRCAWLSIANPSHEEQHRAVVFPSSHAQAEKPQAILSMMAPDRPMSEAQGRILIDLLLQIEKSEVGGATCDLCRFKLRWGRPRIIFLKFITTLGHLVAELINL